LLCRCEPHQQICEQGMALAHWASIHDVDLSTGTCVQGTPVTRYNNKLTFFITIVENREYKDIWKSWTTLSGHPQAIVN